MQGGHWNGRRRHTRFRRFRRERLLLFLLFVALVVFGLVKLIGYGADLLSSRQTAAALREVYREQTDNSPGETPAPAPGPATAAPAAAESASAPTDEPVRRLSAIPYPNNPKLQINSRFKALQKENKDIVGWLVIENFLDEAVVQRDDVFYLDHDALGKKNVNGAIFLDSGISLSNRPYTLTLYGHNMKTGAMFGNLRNFENNSFYHSNPFITFHTKYEEGRYVIFAVGVISTERHDGHYLDFSLLNSYTIQERQSAIEALKAASVHACMLDVQPEDQLLLLVTCVDKDNERRVVAARRVRDGEDEQELIKLVKKSRKR